MSKGKSNLEKRVESQTGDVKEISHGVKISKKKRQNLEKNT